MMNSVVHFEIPFDDAERVQAFYKTHFGWETMAWPMPDGTTYYVARSTPVDEDTKMPLASGAINGGFYERKGALPEGEGCVLVLSVDDIDAKLSAIESAGYSIVMPKIEIGGMGYYAKVTDSEGNPIGLWQDIKK